MKFPGTYRFPENPRIVEFPKSSNHPEIPRGKLSGLEIPKVSPLQFLEIYIGIFRPIETPVISITRDPCGLSNL